MSSSFMGRSSTSRPPVRSVTEINRQVATLLESRFAKLWVEGEISRPTYANSGHVYFTLKDSRSRIDAVLWASAARRLSFRLEEGQKVTIQGSLTLYGPQGRYQLICESVELSGEGALRAALLRLKEKLEGEGLLAEERKRPLPYLPRAVGIATSATGAAIQDMMAMIRSRFPRMKVVLAPVLVQGANAAPSIVEGLRRLQEHPEVEVIIVGRGGGSLEDLWAFNEESVARAIAASELPVISAVGHEIDVTIADLVADARALTPTKAGELAVPREDEIQERLFELRRRGARALRDLLRQQREKLRDLGRRGEGRSLQRLVAERRQRLDELEGLLLRRLRRRSQGERERLSSLGRRLNARSPLRWLGEKSAQVDAARARLLVATRNLCQRRRGNLDALLRALAALDPLAVLERGFSVTRVERDGAMRVLRSAEEARDGELLETRLARGTLRSRVQDADEDTAS